MQERDDFRSALERTLHNNLTISHPIFRLLTEEPNLPLLRQVALQGYQLTKHFLGYIDALYYFCPLPQHKRKLLMNMYEEQTGCLSKTKNHVELMHDFLDALGISDSERVAAEPLPETAMLIDYRIAAVRDPVRFHEGAAAVMIASEGQNLETLGSEPRHSVFSRVYGLNEKALKFFSVHQVEDVGHVRQGLDVVSDACVTAVMQREALIAVDHTCKLFYGMYDGMYRAFCRI